ncbi:sensor histidine kinase [Syntrophomonas palmitatica]|uniref:sensor histidine kinase n=1 Tax=Syntrophomonas palmitatica TaxID=402877 RepID=UPI0006D20B06|nr:sensor histidine kinase [Syntrophomonas palmitatica]
MNLDLELKELNNKISQAIAEVGKYEQLERFARIRLMDVSRNFRSNTEITIKEAYDKAAEFQVLLVESRQNELYLRRQRDQLSKQYKKFRDIQKRADHFLDSTAMALKILRGNVEKINESLEESMRRKRMEMWIIESQEAERRRIARDLHDGPAQSMASMIIRLDLIQQLREEDTRNVYAEIDNVKSMGKETLADIRRIMYDLKPSLFNEDDFSATLRDYLNDYEAKYNFNIDFIVMGNRTRYDRALEIALFRLVQEAVTNVRKHSGLNRAVVKMEDNGSYLTLVIKDEGEGFDLEKVRGNKDSYGILGMMERVKLLGGELEIISSAGSGTQVIVRVPLEGEAANGKNKGLNS